MYKISIILDNEYVKLRLRHTNMSLLRSAIGSLISSNIVHLDELQNDH